MLKFLRSRTNTNAPKTPILLFFIIPIPQHFIRKPLAHMGKLLSHHLHILLHNPPKLRHLLTKRKHHLTQRIHIHAHLTPFNSPQRPQRYSRALRQLLLIYPLVQLQRFNTFANHVGQ